MPHFFASLVYSYGLVYGEARWINGISWSLEVEIHYLVVPLLAMVFRLRSATVRRTLWSAPFYSLASVRSGLSRTPGAAGYISSEDISLTTERAYVRRDIMHGNSWYQAVLKQFQANLAKIIAKTKFSFRNLVT